ncbi:MAG: hypothetical protein ACRDAI_06785 [Candidatus Rhabdochlamydia sp.]
MTSVNPTVLNCQADGLLKIYNYGKNVYFEFAKEKQLQLAKQKIAFARYVTNKCMLHFTKEKATEEGALDIFQSSLILPKNTKFAFGVSAKSIGTVGTPISSREELIKRVADVIATVSVKKDVPIVQIKLEDLKFQS